MEFENGTIKMLFNQIFAYFTGKIKNLSCFLSPEIFFFLPLMDCFILFLFYFQLKRIHVDIFFFHKKVFDVKYLMARIRV